jgi:hypothetical protein
LNDKSKPINLTYKNVGHMSLTKQYGFKVKLYNALLFRLIGCNYILNCTVKQTFRLIKIRANLYCIVNVLLIRCPISRALEQF